MALRRYDSTRAPGPADGPRLRPASDVSPEVATKAWGLSTDKLHQCLRQPGAAATAAAGIVLEEQVAAASTWFQKRYDPGIQTMGDAEQMRRCVSRLGFSSGAVSSAAVDACQRQRLNGSKRLA